jgi:hypothetical protein
MPLPPKRTVQSKFSTGPWTGANQGEKILIYGESGMGKTTLTSMAPDPVFIGLDDGGRKIRNPKTGEQLQFVDGITTFQDVRDALQQINLFDPYRTVAIDTVTMLENLGAPWTFQHVAGPQGKPVLNMEGYGYNKGYKHLWDTMQLILQDCDTLIRAGKNVILVAQSKPAKVANAEGEDFLCDMPSLFSGSPSISASYVEWCDHVLAIRYNGMKVEKKKAGDAERAIFTYPTPYFRAKSRTVKEPIVAFASEADDSIWKFIFGG